MTGLSSIVLNGCVFGISQSLTRKHDLHPIISGWISGICGTPIVFLSDIYKTTIQTYGSPKFTWSYIRSKPGLLLTSQRESLAFASYFGAYDYFHNKCEISPFFAGGFAGITNWTVTYPLDVIRNRQIAKNISAREAYEMGKLWKGYPICVVRAFMVNSVGFYVFEKLKYFLEEKEYK